MNDTLLRSSTDTPQSGDFFRWLNLSVIIVTWNAKQIVRECLGSLNTYAGDSGVEIIVVDNGSSDGTPDMINEQFAHVTLVRNPENAGFARATNIGIRLATKEYICLLNSDVIVPEGCLEKMVCFLSQQPDIGVLGPKMILPDGTIGQSCMRYPNPWNWMCRAFALDMLFKPFRLFGGFLMTDFQYNRIVDVDVLTGWFWLTRRQALDRVGPLDERFFMYGEDIDWCKRFREAGWRVVFYSDASAIHYCGASSARKPTQFYIEMTRADMQYWEKHHGRLARCGFWLGTSLHQLARILGYGLVYVLRRGNHTEAEAKVRRSLVCLRWLLVSGAVQLWEAK
jgi:GT2 family glycosyltransferase